MSLLKTVHEDEATGALKQIYDGFGQILGKVPNVMKFHSVSPVIYVRFMDIVNQFSDHLRLDPILLNYLRIIVSYRNGGEYCVKFQSHLAKLRGETEANIEIAKKHTTNLQLDEKRKSLLLFALNLLEGKNENIEEKLENLHCHGWTDQDIYEFCFLAGLQMGMIPLINGFKVKHDF